MLWFGERLMLAKRLDTKTFSGFYEAVGGKVEEGETISRAIQREIREEAGIFVPIYELESVDCITDDPTTEKCFIFRRATYPNNFSDVTHRERRKRTPWKLYTIEEALKLKLMPGLKENMSIPAIQ